MDIKQEVEERYSKLTEKEKEAIVKKNRKDNFVLNVTLVIMCSVFTLVFLILTFVLKSDDDKSLFLGLSISMLVVGVGICVPLILIDKKSSNETIIKKELKSIIKKEIYEKQTLLGFVLDENIIAVKLIDAYTVVTDKLHAVLNYQEIIQTRYYKFRVDYKDGHSDIITEKEVTARCMALMKFIDKKSAKNDKQVDSAEELKKYKGLFDDGLISEEEYNAKKKQILGL